MRKVLIFVAIAFLLFGVYPPLVFGQETDDDSFIATLAWMVVTGDRMDGVVDGNDLANIQALADEYYDDAIYYAQQNNAHVSYIKLLEARKAELQKRLDAKIAQTPQGQGQAEADRFTIDFLDTIARGGQTDSRSAIMQAIITGGADSVDLNNLPSEPDPLVTGYQDEIGNAQIQQNAAHALTAEIAAQADQGRGVADALAGDGYQLPVPVQASDAADTVSQDAQTGVVVGGVKPLRFENRGSYDAVVDLNDYWYVGLDGLGLAAGGNAQINLKPGAHQFCFQWKVGEFSVWSLTGSYTILEDASEDASAAQTVYIDTDTANYSQGTCADRTPSQSNTSDNVPSPTPETEIELTPEEKANAGTHAYMESCTYSDGESNSGGPFTYTFEFDDPPTGDKVVILSDSAGVIGGFSRSGDNWYEAYNMSIQFTTSGWTAYRTYENGLTSTCTRTK